MKVLVPVKRVTDPNVSIRVKADGSGVELANVKMAVNPFCEIAVEEAVQLAEKGIATEVVVVSIGEKKCQEQIRASMAMGADRGIHIETDEPLEALSIAKLLAKVVEEEQPGLVILGKQSVDEDNSQTGQMLAALTNMPQATFVSKIEVGADSLTATREVDAGLETIKINMPAIVTTDLRLNQPRYPKLPNIMKAKKKPLEVKTVADLGVDITPRVKTLKVESPASRQAGVIVGSVAELVDKLKNEAKVI